MKRPTRILLDNWYGILTETDDPQAPHDIVPAPEPLYSPELPINMAFGRPAFNF